MKNPRILKVIYYPYGSEEDCDYLIIDLDNVATAQKIIKRTVKKFYSSKCTKLDEEYNGNMYDAVIGEITKAKIDIFVNGVICFHT
jgi:hypothetical protein